MDVEERKCECGEMAAKINRCDFGEVATCRSQACLLRASKEIADQAKRHPERLRVFDAITPIIDESLGTTTPTDRVLAIAYALLDGASALLCALMRVRPSADVDAVKEITDRWVVGAIDVLGRNLAPHSEPPDPVD